MGREKSSTPEADENVVTFTNHGTPKKATIESEASAWVVRLDKGKLSHDEQRAFEDWLRTSDQHQQIWAQLNSLWGALDGLSELKHTASAALKPTWLERVGFELKHRLVASAASAVAVVLLVVLVGPSAVSESHYVRAHRTVIGTQKTINLPDGSVLLLNTNSHVDVEYSGKHRNVFLHQGEVHFSVAPDKSRPFSVYVDSRVVTAVGTAFTIFRRTADIEITVTEGDVALSLVSDESTDLLGQMDIVRTPALANLTAGENVVFSDTVEQVEVIPQQEINRKLSWRHGLLAFAGEPLRDVIAEVSRYTEVSIVITDPALNDLRFGGFFKVGNVDALFDALEQSFGVKVDRGTDSKVYLSSSAG